MTKLGMNVDEIRGLAARLDDEAQRVQGVIGVVDGLVRRVAADWNGGSAQSFVADWHSRYRPLLRRVRDSITGLATSARNNAAGQEGVSGAPGSGVRLRDGQSATYASDHLRITAHGPSQASGPRDVRGLLSYLSYDDGARGDNSLAYHYPGGISVTMIGIPPHRRVIVAISGTEQWLPDRTNIDDGTTNGENAVGAYTAKEDAIREAMLRAGVTPSDRVMLLGHSQGGADAMAFAHDYAKDPAFHIAAVVTAGQPPEPKVPPAGVDVLQLRGSADVIPSLGMPWAASEHSGHVVTVPEHSQRIEEFLAAPGGLLAELPIWNQAHDPTSYQAGIPEHDPAIAEFEHRHSEFFGGEPSTTWVYQNERVPPPPAPLPPPLTIDKLLSLRNTP